MEQWIFLADPLAVHSGATVREFHPLPFSPVFEAGTSEQFMNITIPVSG
jgi:hypothetical protein